MCKLGLGGQTASHIIISTIKLSPFRHKNCLKILQRTSNTGSAKHAGPAGCSLYAAMETSTLKFGLRGQNILAA